MLLPELLSGCLRSLNGTVLVLGVQACSMQRASGWSIRSSQHLQPHWSAYKGAGTHMSGGSGRELMRRCAWLSVSAVDQPGSIPAAVPHLPLPQKQVRQLPE